MNIAPLTTNELTKAIWETSEYLENNSEIKKETNNNHN